MALRPQIKEASHSSEAGPSLRCLLPSLPSASSRRQTEKWSDRKIGECRRRVCRESRGSARLPGLHVIFLSPHISVSLPSLSVCSLRQQFLDYRGFDAGQTLVQALVLDREPLMVEAQQVQDGGVEIARWTGSATML